MHTYFRQIQFYILIVLGLFISQISYSQKNEVLVVPKQYKAENLVSHQPILANAANFFLTASKAESTELFEITQKGLKKKFKLTAPILAAQGNRFWLQVGDSLHAYSLASNELLEKKALPDDVQQVSAIEMGLGDTLFIADALNQKLYASVNDAWKLIASGNYLGKPQALFRLGGSLYVGTDKDLRVVKLSTQQVKPLTAGLNNVQTITQDHQGYLLVFAADDHEIVRIGLDGVQKVLPIQVTDISSIAFNSETAKLIMLNPQKKKIMIIDYLRVMRQSRTAWETKSKRP